MSFTEARAMLLRFPVSVGANLAASPAARTIRAQGIPFELEHLFTAPGREGVGVAVAGTGGGGEWYIARASKGTSGAHAWELAHAALAQGAALAGASPDFVEPDLLQDWPYQRLQSGGPELLGAAKEVCKFDDQILDNLPGCADEFAWHLDDRFSQLRAARAHAGEAGNAHIVRIAHLDTGYDPSHSTFQADQIDAELQRNFIDPDKPNDARDPQNSGLLKNPGHGTGTLSILNGGAFSFSQAPYQFNDVLGGAPRARVVPVRVGNSVVQISTSSIARGISYAAGLCNNGATRVDVMSMSMGGVASAAWADAVNKAYEAGIVFVAAAGNNFSAGFFGFPTHFVVYPARFRRVIAVCGVMANRRPYYGLTLGTMQGNWGPDSKMATAVAAYSPNISWAQIGCAKIVDMNGAGTSAATPQVAAAAALYFQTHADALFDRAKYPDAWMRVEAVRRAMFLSADKSADSGKTEKLGNGILQAARMLEIAPADAATLHRTDPDSASFSFLRVLNGFGVAPSSADQMLQLEATQLAQSWPSPDHPNPLESAVPDPDRPADNIAPDHVRRFLEALRDHPDASAPLKRRATEVLDRMSGPGKPPARKPRPAGPKPAASQATPPASVARQRLRAVSPPAPPYRRLRGFAIDPSLSKALDTVAVSEITFHVPWEKLKPGPVGEYIEVIDVDPASKCFYEPVDLDDPALLAQDGLPPGEGTPQFHQQMAYAVASLTIENFEHALGRRALWRPGPTPNPQNPHDDSNFVQRLRIYPHALREANAYFSPDKIALLFGYFNAADDDPGDHMPGARVFTCLSHDIVAHETTHALLDGMHRRFMLPSNPDVRAFHEAFADIVALFQHFTIPEILRHQIAATRGEIGSQQNLLGQMATEFGRATGLRQALRDAIGEVKNGVWLPHKPEPDEYRVKTEPHERGSILVAAVFDAFLAIYERRVLDLLRLATGGSGILRPGAIHPDLVNRLSDEAAKSAQHVLTMCVRALDYCPPTDITFGEYLRAVITADFDLVPDDDLNYRVAFVEAFRGRGIFPPGLRTLGIQSLRWRSPESENPPPSARFQDAIERLRSYAMANLDAHSRGEVFHLQRAMRRDLHEWLKQHFAGGADGAGDAAFLGLDPSLPFEVHTARFAHRTSSDGGVATQLLVGLLQETQMPVDPSDPTGAKMPFEGGCTIVADVRSRKIQYCVRKNLGSAERLDQQQAFALASLSSSGATYLGATPLGIGEEPFAAIHRGI